MALQARMKKYNLYLLEQLFSTSYLEFINSGLEFVEHLLQILIQRIVIIIFTILDTRQACYGSLMNQFLYID